MEPALPPESPEPESRVVDLRARRADRRLGELEARAATAEAEARTLRDRLAAAELVRDRLADQLAASRTVIRAAHDEVRVARQQVTDRLAGEVRALALVGDLQAELGAVKARLGGRDDRNAVLAKLAGELADAARLAREDVERHTDARADAETRLEECQQLLASERARAAEVVAALRAELERLRGAHDDAVVAHAHAEASRRAELRELHAARDRLREPESAPAAPEGVIVDLARAAERLRTYAPGSEATTTVVRAAPARAGWRLLRRTRVRRVLAALSGRRQ